MSVRVFTGAAVVWSIAAAMLAGCAGSSAGHTAFLSSQALTAVGHTSRASASGQFVFVTNETGGGASGEVDYYPVGSNGDVVPTGVISGSNTGLTYEIQGIVVNTSGQILVANFKSNTILEFAPHATGNVSPIATITGPSTGLAKPFGLALDGAGNIYVANCSRATFACALGTPSQGQPSVEEFAAGSSGNAAPIRFIAGPRTQLYAPFGIAVGGDGNIYVGDSGNPPSTPCAILVFGPNANGNATPKQVIAGPNTGIDIAGGLTMNRFGVYADPHPSSGASVERFRLRANGNATPRAVIKGSNTQLDDNADGMASGPDDSVYVAEPSGPSILRFAPLANGNAPPLSIISGPNTRLQFTAFVFVGPQP